MTHEHWYALTVRTRTETAVGAGLRNKGYETFLPIYRCQRRWSDRIKTLELPLFPGYVFCKFDAEQRLPILMTSGVRSIVSYGKIPEPIHPPELLAIRAIVESGAAYEPCPYLAVGQSVRIRKGCLSGLTGFIIQMKDDVRLVISLNLLMRSVSVDIDQSWIEPVARKQAA